MKTENKIVKAFIDDKKHATIREIAKRIKSDYRITYIAIQRLIQKDIIVAKKVGKSILCNLNEEYYGLEIYQAEEERKKRILQNKSLNVLYHDIIEKVGSSFFIFLLFGSYASNKQTKHSDIDLMFISNHKGFEERIHNILSLLPLKTHPLVFTETQFKSMIESKKSNVCKEVLKNNVILYGIESFYMMKNA